MGPYVIEVVRFLCDQAEYEEARKELQMQVAQGVSIAKIRARLQGKQVDEEELVDEEKPESSGNGKLKLDIAGSRSRKSQVQKVRKTLPKISRKKWSTDELFNRFTPGSKAGSGTSAPPKELTPLQKAAQKLDAVDGGEVILKQFFRAGNEDLLVRFKRYRVIKVASGFVGLSSSLDHLV